MKKRKRQRKRRKQMRNIPLLCDDEFDAYSIGEFCARHRISRAMFYKLRRQGEGPMIMRVGTHIRISKENAARWRKQMEMRASDVTNLMNGNDSDVYTIDEFCERYKISKAMFYKLRRNKKGPAAMYIGSALRIPKDTAERLAAALRETTGLLPAKDIVA
jgi:Helix-turn-helix domain